MSANNYKTLRRYHQFLKFKRDFNAAGLRKVLLHEVFLFWLHKNTSRNQFMILAGILVGASAGLAAVVLKTLVHYIHFLITQKFVFEQQLFFYFIFPLLGIVLTTLVVIVFFKGQDRKGIPAILYEIAQGSSLVSHVKMYSQVIQSAITVGLGGSAGLESPIAVTGSAIGSNFAQKYHLDYRDRTLLLASGATAGIAAAFNAPIAGMMFAFEILLTGVVFSDFIPLIVASVCGSLVSRIVLNEETLFLFRSRHAFDYRNIPYYLVLAVVCGFYARYFVVVSHWVEHRIKALKLSRLQKALAGGLTLSLLCCLFPPLFGEGYQTIKDIVAGRTETLIGLSFFKYLSYHSWFVLLFLGLICLMKAFATSITIFSGGNGGNFAPSLFAGSTLGYFMAVAATLCGLPHVPVSNMVIVGMAGVMSGVLYAPLTAIFLIAESSSGYDLFLPLMIVSVTSYLMAKHFSPVAPDLTELADKGQIFTREHDRNLLSLIHVCELIDTDIQTIAVDAPFEELISLVRGGKRNMVAVINSDHQLAGIITLESVWPIMFDRAMYLDLSIAHVMKQPPAVITNEEDMESIINKFDQTGSWNLPVVQHGKFLGIISKSGILNRYRLLLKEYS